MRARGALLGCLNRLAGAAAAGRPSRGAAATRTLSSVTRPTESGVFELPELKLAAGGVLRPARLAWASYGEPGAPVILHPTSFDARTPDLEYAIGHGERFILDTRRHRNLLGNGLSSSPSNAADGAAFPLCTLGDNVALQHAFLTQRLGVRSLALCYGYSMGAAQALTWAAVHPSMVASVAATCGTASCGQYNAVFLEGLLSVLRSSPEWAAGAGFCRSPPLAQLAAFGRVYAGWGLPGEWYRAQLWRRHGGHASLEAFLRDSWEAWTVGADANDLVAMLRTWRAASVADAVAGAAPPAEGGVAPTPEAAAEAAAAALARVTARVVYLPGPGDRYFPLEEVEAEAAAVGGRKGAGADVVPLTHEWGHRAGDPHRPGQERDYDTIRAAVRRLLQGGS